MQSLYASIAPVGGSDALRKTHSVNVYVDNPLCPSESRIRADMGGLTGDLDIVPTSVGCIATLSQDGLMRHRNTYEYSLPMKEELFHANSVQHSLIRTNEVVFNSDAEIKEAFTVHAIEFQQDGQRKSEFNFMPVLVDGRYESVPDGYRYSARFSPASGELLESTEGKIKGLYIEEHNILDWVWVNNEIKDFRINTTTNNQFARFDVCRNETDIPVLLNALKYREVQRTDSQEVSNFKTFAQRSDIFERCPVQVEVDRKTIKDDGGTSTVYFEPLLDQYGEIFFSSRPSYVAKSYDSDGNAQEYTVSVVDSDTRISNLAPPGSGLISYQEVMDTEFGEKYVIYRSKNIWRGTVMHANEDYLAAGTLFLAHNHKVSFKGQRPVVDELFEHEAEFYHVDYYSDRPNHRVFDFYRFYTDLAPGEIEDFDLADTIPAYQISAVEGGIKNRAELWFGKADGVVCSEKNWDGGTRHGLTHLEPGCFNRRGNEREIVEYVEGLSRENLFMRTKEPFEKSSLLITNVMESIHITRKSLVRQSMLLIKTVGDMDGLQGQTKWAR